MRASMRGSIRKVIVTDSDTSEDAATDESISRKSRRFSAQKAASASSLSKSGISFQLFRAFMWGSGASEVLVHFALVEILLLHGEWPGVNHSHRFAVRAVNTENPCARGRYSQIEIARLRRKPR